MLFDALVTGDCVICLQPLIEGPSTHNSPQKDAGHGRASEGKAHTTGTRLDATASQQSRGSSSTFTPAGAVTHALASSSSASGFHVSYAPGVPRYYEDFSSGQTAASVGSSSAAPPQPEQARRLNEVTLLPCGHGFFHYGCILQLYEYSQDSKCPVCRAPIRSVDDLIPFRPRSRPSQLEGVRVEINARPQSPARQCSASPSTVKSETSGEGQQGHHHHHHETVLLDRVAPNRKRVRASPSHSSASPSRAQARHVESVDSGDEAEGLAFCPEPSQVTPTRTTIVAAIAINDEDDHVSEIRGDEEVEEEEITLLGSRQVDPSEAYCGLLERITSQYEERAANVHERGLNLQASFKELEEDCRELELTVTDCRRRKALLGDRSDGQRLLELRRACAETRQTSECVARELASAIRENAELQRQIDKFKRKTERLT